MAFRLNTDKTEKTSLVNDDLFLLEDSADSFNVKKVKQTTVADYFFTNRVLDEDTMTSNSASHVPTQQSVKAYVDNLDGLQFGDIVGVEIANDTTDILNDLIFTAGFCWDDTYTKFMKIDLSYIKQGDAVFAEGNNAGMLQSGQTFSANKTYHIYMIAKEDGTTDYQMTENGTAFVFPTGYTYKRRIFSMKTKTAAAEWEEFIFTRKNKTVKWKTKKLTQQSWQVPTSATLVAMDVPLGISVMSIFLFSTGGATTSYGQFNIYSPDETPLTLVETVDDSFGTFNGVVGFNTAAAGVTVSKVFSSSDFKTNTSGQLYFIKTTSAPYNSTRYSTLQTHGWIDYTL